MPPIRKALALTPEMQTLDNPNADTNLGTPTSDAIQINPGFVDSCWNGGCMTTHAIAIPYTPSTSTLMQCNKCGNDSRMATLRQAGCKRKS